MQDAPVGRSLEAFQDVILTVSSSLDPATVLQRVVELIAGATGSSDAYIFRHDADAGELVLAAATESAAAPFVGALRIPLGEGITGYVGAARTTYVVARDLHRDPRFVLHPGLGEERYAALICVPIVSRAGELVGVVSVWSPVADHFTAEHVRLAEWIAVVVAGAIENAELHASLRRRTHVLERLAELTAMATSGLATAKLLERVTDLAREVGDADLAVLLVRDPSGADRLILKGVGAPDAAAAAPLDAARRELVAVDAEVRRRGITWPVAADDVRARLAARFGATAAAPLRVAGEELGLLLSYRIAARPFAAADQSLLATIAGNAALALKNALLAEQLEQHNELGHLLRDVAAGRLEGAALRERAALVGLAARGYAVAVGVVERDEPAPTDVEGAALVLRQIAAAIADRLPGARCTATAHEVVALLPRADADETVVGALEDVVGEARGRHGVVLTFGLSAAADSLDELRAALAEAREVAAAGSGGGVRTLDDSGHELLLRRAADLASVRDRYSAAVERIAEYDRVRRGALLETLAVFLDLRNRNEAARALFVHRNTLAQRLARIEYLTGLDLSASEQWFPLQLALRIHQLRRAAPAP